MTAAALPPSAIPHALGGDELRLMARVARLYYDDGLRQTAIAERLGLSQTRVSRLLKRALDTGLVRVTVLSVPGLESEIERELQESFSLRQAVVVDVDGPDVLPAIGASAAYHLETTIKSDQLVGVASRSRSVLSTVELMRPLTTRHGVRVVQVFGGIGDPSSTRQSNRLTELLAERTRGEPVFLGSPALAASATSAAAFVDDPHVRAAMGFYDQLDAAVVGLGVLDDDAIAARAGDPFSRSELEELRRAGAVGDVCFRFFDAEGQPVTTTIDQRIIGIHLQQLRSVPHCVCVAGGTHKTTAIRAALRAGFIDVLVTDRPTAECVVADI